MATAFGGQAQIASHYQRLQRFFRDFELDYAVLARAVVALLKIPEPWVVSVDRTEWQFGGCTFNILTLGIVYEGIAMPVGWTMLDKRGNSNTLERMQLWSQFLPWFPERKIADLSADREFIGQDWFCYLRAQPQTPFRICIRQNHNLKDGNRTLKLKTVFQDLQTGQQKVLGHKWRLWGVAVYLAALRLDDGELLVVATQAAPETAIADYANRWGIETLFGILKTRGFCLESTPLKDSKRLSKLLALLTLALCWAVRTGQWLHQRTPLKLKKHGRRSQSLFRYGFDYLRSICLNLESRSEDFWEVLQFLSCT